MKVFSEAVIFIPVVGLLEYAEKKLIKREMGSVIQLHGK
jgi:hypothetical protein